MFAYQTNMIVGDHVVVLEKRNLDSSLQNSRVRLITNLGSFP